MTNDAASDLLDELRHTHDHGAAVASHEARTRWVVALTLAMMVAELVVGYATNSLALTADGWHMATHAGALGMAALAYWFARRQSGSSVFSFGTGKVHALAGYTSAVVLSLIALLMVVESLRRFLRPAPIAFSEALPVAVLGLAVNLVSVKLLHTDEHHGADHDEDHEHDDGEHAPHRHEHAHHGHDHNLRAAYFHVLADALTSVLAILALLGGRYFGWTFLDAAMGVVGGVVIARWSYGLCRQAAKQLLDVVPSEEITKRIRRRIESEFAGAAVVDLHLWDIGPRARACIVSIAARSPQPPIAYREALTSIASLQHVTVEVHPLPAAQRSAAAS
ncbi:CDF family Co(II)/Ni(II) efflux transporter DmeF [Sorangium sp. So ce1036]|uniref:CDF family Co(II)/Ni(II) efflux transporter DmeF n=1 Tax=Sorangium sp. So ce1036 TaxID=3133328 RepID=UPI003F05180D